jgi:hypothetical protein
VLPHADGTRKALGCAGSGDDGPAHLGLPEACGAGGDADVAGEREFHAARQRVAVNGGDQRLPGLEATGYSAEVEAVEAVLAREAAQLRNQFLQIGPCAEGAIARSGENGDPDIGVVPDICPNANQLVVGGDVDRVEGVGPVDGDRGDVIAAFILDVHTQQLCDQVRP